MFSFTLSITILSYTRYTHIAASSTVTAHVTDYITHRITNTTDNNVYW